MPKLLDGMQGCGDHSCVFGVEPGTWATNGGCRCLKGGLPQHIIQKNIQILQRSVECWVLREAAATAYGIKCDIEIQDLKQQISRLDKENARLAETVRSAP